MNSNSSIWSLSFQARSSLVILRVVFKTCFVTGCKLPGITSVKSHLFCLKKFLAAPVRSISTLSVFIRLHFAPSGMVTSLKAFK